MAAKGRLHREARLREAVGPRLLRAVERHLVASFEIRNEQNINNNKAKEKKGARSNCWVRYGMVRYGTVRYGMVWYDMLCYVM